MPRALVTGITGQDGQYMAEFLRSKGYDVFGLVTGQHDSKVEALVDEFPYVEPLSGDLRDLSSLIAAVEQSQPDEVYNLGAISFVALSFKQPELTAEVTGLGVLRMLEAIRVVGGMQNNPIRFYQASSSEMFGKVREVPQKETTPFHPRSPYGVAKVFGHQVTVNYREAYGLYACSGICFNHECVPADTPVVVRRHGLVDVVPVGDVVPHRTDPRKGKRYVSEGGGLEVWDGNDWTRCIARTATWHEEPIVVIHGRGGVIQATEDHVVFTADDAKPASDFSKGDKLRLGLQPPHTFVTTLTEDEAWLLGILAAEGWISEEGKGRITCGDEAVLAEAATCWERVAAGVSQKTVGPRSAFSDKRTSTLELTGNRAYLRMLRSELYTRDGQKRIPIRVLNAAPKLQLEFLSAYNEGDGLRAGHGADQFKAFRTSSPVLAAGLVWLARTTIGRRVSVYLQPGKLGQRSYLINLGSGKVRGPTGAHLRRPPDEVRRVDKRQYRGWMCDLATDSGRFAAGVGFVVVHNSPRRGPEFISRKITKALARIKLGLQEEVALGNLDSRRDWGYAGEYVEAMWLMLQQDEPDDYVVATGELHSGREFVRLAFEHAGIGDWEAHVKFDPRMLRPSEVDQLVGDPSKAKTILGWEPKVGFEELVRLMVDADLKVEQSRL